MTVLSYGVLYDQNATVKQTDIILGVVTCKMDSFYTLEIYKMAWIDVMPEHAQTVKKLKWRHTKGSY